MKTACSTHRLFLILVICCFTGCKDRVTEMNATITSVITTYIPDKRTDIGNIEAYKFNKDTVVLKGETTLEKLRSEIINTLDNQDYFLVDSIVVLPDTSVNKRYLGLATLSVINLRKEPDHSSELVSQAIMGTPVMLLKEEGSWYLVRTPDKYISWTERSSVRAVTAGEMKEWRNAERVIFEKNSGWLFSNIAETGIVSDLVNGCILARTGEAGSYDRVMLPDGREGFVLKSSVTLLDQFLKVYPAAGEEIISRASTLIGIPYLWGGSSSKGADCSGLVQNVYFMNGLIVPRDASQQALYGDSVDISDGFSALQPGDLLFFGSPKRISHVAIYKGDNEYIHSSGRVMVNSLDSTRNNYSSYRKNSLVKAMRILNSADPGIVPVNEHPWY